MDTNKPIPRHLSELVKTELFISKAKIMHGDKYDYSKSWYKLHNSKITIICYEHGEFTQTPNSHLNGSGCPSCSGNKKKDTKKFIEDAIKIHGDKYNYDKVEYQNSHSKVTIICTKHGEFLQSANNHLKGYGCKKCSPNVKSPNDRETQGWGKTGYYKTGKPSFIYLIKVNEEFLKVGISNNPRTRFQHLKNQFKRLGEPLDIKRILCFVGEANKVYDVENRVLFKEKFKKYKPSMVFNGSTECFSLEESANIASLIKEEYMNNSLGDIKPRDMFNEYLDIPKYIRVQVEYSTAIYFSEVYMSDFLRACWENDHVTLEEIRVEMRGVVENYVLDAAMDLF